MHEEKFDFPILIIFLNILKFDNLFCRQIILIFTIFQVKHKMCLYKMNNLKYTFMTILEGKTFWIIAIP